MSEHNLHSVKAGAMGGMLLAMLWLVLLHTYPLIWAIVTANALLLLFGYFTTKSILRIRDRRAAALLTPVFGLGWLAFFWIVFKVAGG